MQGALFNFIETDPNGCYDLLLSDPWGRTLAQHLHALAVEDGQRRKRAKPQQCDLSQAGNWHAWRNVSLNGVPILYQDPRTKQIRSPIDESWVVPDAGVLRFDHCSFMRPLADAQPIPSLQFERLLLLFMAKVEETSPMQALQWLRRHVAGKQGSTSYPGVECLWLSAQQVSQIIQTFAEPKLRLEALLGLWGQLVDEEQVCLVMGCLETPEKQRAAKDFNHLPSF